MIDQCEFFGYNRHQAGIKSSVVSFSFPGLISPKFDLDLQIFRRNARRFD
jgi:hypothetical protein